MANGIGNYLGDGTDGYGYGNDNTNNNYYGGYGNPYGNLGNGLGNTGYDASGIGGLNSGGIDASVQNQLNLLQTGLAESQATSQQAQQLTKLEGIYSRAQSRLALQQKTNKMAVDSLQAADKNNTAAADKATQQAT